MKWCRYAKVAKVLDSLNGFKCGFNFVYQVKLVMFCYVYLLKQIALTSNLFNFARTVLVLIKLTKFAFALRLRCGSCKFIFDIISSFFAKFKNVVHSLEPDETPSNSASHQAPNYVQRS